MAYEVTANRRRPQRFEDLAGQEFVAATLQNAITAGQIAHAYLFAGPRGCGKTSSARILAKSLNCEKGPAASPCGQCTACREIALGSSLDVIEIDGASNTSVNDIRQIKDEVLFPPNSCRYKVYIIDEVHMLSMSAFNALLKTIEEPPPYVVFIFATTELHKVPATIKSRCQQFHFRLVAAEQIKELLAAAAEELHITADAEALYWIAREARGSIRDAYTLFDQTAAFSDGHITYDKIRGTLGLIGTDMLNELYERCAEGNASQAVLTLDRILHNGVSIEQFVSDSAEYLRSLLFVSSGITRESLLGQAAERFSPAVLAAWKPVQLERALSLFLTLYRDIRYSLDARYEAELAVLRLCSLSGYVSAGEVKDAVDAARALLMRDAGAAAQGAPADSVRMQSARGYGADVHSTPAGGFIQKKTESDPTQGTGAARPVSMPAGVSAGMGAGLNAGSSAESGAAPVLPQFAAMRSLVSQQAGDGGGHTDSQRSCREPVTERAASAAAPDTDVLRPDAAQDTLHTAPDSVPPARQPQEAAVREQAPLPVSELQEAAVKELMHQGEAGAAMLLSRTKSWVLEGETVRARADSAFTCAQLAKEAAKIGGCLSDLLGKNIAFEAELDAPAAGAGAETGGTAAPAGNNDLPVQAQILCSLFKGSVIGGIE